ncbi:MAG: hypothetical protein JNK29_08160 [Anaerolineales bacterium]|nr:hypothetical protein [Anaerolineales bacterium]
MKPPIQIALLSCLVLALACGGGQPAAGPAPAPTAPAASVFDAGRTAYGFFPSPPRATLDSVLQHFQALGEHADFVLVQENVVWEDFVQGAAGESQKRTDLLNLMTLARGQGLEALFVVDALNGLNRREFAGLPAGWEASFANPQVRAAVTNFALWIVRAFHPRYLGLASEINTYADAHPADFPHYLSLYREIYALVKAEAPATQIFVSFQWEDLNNLFAQAAEGRAAYATNWDQVEAFEPELDVWVISSYPFFVFPAGADIPADYYTPLLARTPKPVAVAEGGFASRPFAAWAQGGTPQDQVAYLNALHGQLGERLAFWVYLLLNDFDPDSYAAGLPGKAADDLNTLGFFTAVGLREADGTPKPALEVWDRLRAGP